MTKPTVEKRANDAWSFVVLKLFGVFNEEIQNRPAFIRVMLPITWIVLRHSPPIWSQDFTPYWNQISAKTDTLPWTTANKG